MLRSTKCQSKLVCPESHANGGKQVYGPHIAVLYGSNLAQSWMASLGHYFHAPADTLAIKLGLAAASYELVAAIPSVLSYFGSDRKKTWKAIAAHEGKLQQILLEYLNNRKDIVIYGETSADAKLRVPVVSFSVNGKSSQDIVEKVEACSNYGIRNGHFYSKRAVDNLLGLKADGVIRVSMVHYNTGTPIFGTNYHTNNTDFEVNKKTKLQVLSWCWIRC